MKKLLLIVGMVLFNSASAFCDPILILLSGPPGWGKTTLSEKLATKFGFARLDFDSIAEPFSPGKRDSEYAKNIEPKVITAVLNLAKYNFQANRSVLVDGTWSHLFYANEKYLRQVQDFVAETGVKLVVLEGTAPRSVIIERLKNRNSRQDDLKLENPNAFFKNDHVGQPNLLNPHFEISGEGTENEIFEKACKILEQHF